MESTVFFAQHVVQFEDATDVDAIVASAMLVGSAFNPGREIEPVALLECMAHGTSCTCTSKLNLCLQLFNLNSFRPAGPELPRGSSWTVSKRSEWTTAPLNSIKAASFVFIKQENESSTNPHVGPLKM